MTAHPLLCQRFLLTRKNWTPTTRRIHITKRAFLTSLQFIALLLTLALGASLFAQTGATGAIVGADLGAAPNSRS